jgi:mRNA-degrading endonuclease toxin of MazEF toxin-antitoxin module
LIIQNDIGNEVSPVTIVAAISPVIKASPINMEIKPSESGLEKDSVIKLNQIRTIDKRHPIRCKRKNEGRLKKFPTRYSLFKERVL